MVQDHELGRKVSSLACESNLARSASAHASHSVRERNRAGIASPQGVRLQKFPALGRRRYVADVQPARPTLAWFGDAVPSAAGPDEVGDDDAGEGRYTVLRLVGAGGMGNVYQARDRLLERDVALKVMRADIPPAERRRFRREALLGARLLHPSLVRVYDMGLASTGEAEWMAMEYLPGVDALRLLEGAYERGHGLPWAALLRLLDQVLGALQYCHDCRIVHRDVKPANMFVTRDPNTRFLTTKLLDLGIAQDLEGPAPSSRVEMLCGDPNYMAPEQTLSPRVDPRADIYAMGISLFELTTGTLPFAALEDSPLADLLAAQREADVGRPSLQMPLGTPAVLARRIDAVVARACAKRPEARYQSAREMRDALHAPL